MRPRAAVLNITYTSSAALTCEIRLASAQTETASGPWSDYTSACPLKIHLPCLFWNRFIVGHNHDTCSIHAQATLLQGTHPALPLELPKPPPAHNVYQCIWSWTPASASFHCTIQPILVHFITKHSGMPATSSESSRWNVSALAFPFGNVVVYRPHCIPLSATLWNSPLQSFKNTYTLLRVMRGLRPFILLGLEHNAMSLLHSTGHMLHKSCQITVHIWRICCQAVSLIGNMPTTLAVRTPCTKCWTTCSISDASGNWWWTLSVSFCWMLPVDRSSPLHRAVETSYSAPGHLQAKKKASVLTCPHCRHSLARSGLIPPLRKLAGIVIVKTLLCRCNFGGCNSCALASDYAASQSNNQDSFHFLPPNLMTPRT